MSVDTQLPVPFVHKASHGTNSEQTHCDFGKQTPIPCNVPQMLTFAKTMLESTLNLLSVARTGFAQLRPLVAKKKPAHCQYKVTAPVNSAPQSSHSVDVFTVLLHIQQVTPAKINCAVCSAAAMRRDSAHDSGNPSQNPPTPRHNCSPQTDPQRLLRLAPFPPRLSRDHSQKHKDTTSSQSAATNKEYRKLKLPFDKWRRRGTAVNDCCDVSRGCRFFVFFPPPRRRRLSEKDPASWRSF